MKFLFFLFGLALTMPQGARTESHPPFSLEYQANSASIIARGSWSNDHFTADSFPKGSKQAFAALDPAALDKEIQNALKSVPDKLDPRRLTIFANKERVPSEAVVIETDRDLWAILEGGASGQLNAAWARTPLSASDWPRLIDAALERQAARHSIAAMKPGPGRAEALANFLRSVPASEGDEAVRDWWKPRSFHLLQLKNSGFRLSSEEETHLFDLADRLPSAERAAILACFQVFPAGAGGLARLTPALEEPAGTDLRRTAIRAVGLTGSPEAQALLIGLLPAQDTDFRIICQAIANRSSLPMRKSAVEALCTAAQKAVASYTAGDHESDSRIYAILSILSSPFALETVASLALDSGIPPAHQAYGNLCEITGVRFPRDDSAAWRQWLEKSRAFLSTEHFLDTPQDVDAWLLAWADAPDENIRHLMEKSTLFSDHADYDYLLQQARSSAHVPASKATLAALWRRGELPPRWRGEIVRNFMSPLRIREKVYPNAQREVTATATRDFPFPENAWVHINGAMAVGATYPLVFDRNDGHGSFSLADSDPRLSKGGVYRGSPAARAICEIWEPDPADRSRALWSHRWEAAPVTLSAQP